MLILKPGADTFTIYALLPIGAAFFYGFSIATLPKFDKSISNAVLYLYSSVAAAIGAVVLAAFTTDFSPIISYLHLFMIFVMSILQCTFDNPCVYTRQVSLTFEILTNDGTFLLKPEDKEFQNPDV